MAESRSSAGQASANSPWTCRHEDGGPPRRRRTRVSRRPGPRGREGRPQADHRGPGPHRAVESRAPDPLWRGRHRRGEGRDRCRAHGRGGDRKSTRLNSSHLVISYAVFCLKKKNKMTKLSTEATLHLNNTI